MKDERPVVMIYRLRRVAVPTALVALVVDAALGQRGLLLDRDSSRQPYFKYFRRDGKCPLEDPPAPAWHGLGWASGSRGCSPSASVDSGI